MHYFYLIGLSEVSHDSSLVQNKLPDFADRLAVGSQTVALGMLIVFAVLATLWLILEIAGRMSSSKNKSIKTIETTKQETFTFEPQTVDEAPTTDDEEEIVAAITAAISMMLEAEGQPSKGFRVVSFKRSDKTAHWNR